MNVYVATLTTPETANVRELVAALFRALPVLGRHPLALQQTLLRELTDGVDADVRASREQHDLDRIRQRIDHADAERLAADAAIVAAREAFKSAVVSGDPERIRTTRQAWLDSQDHTETFAEELRILGSMYASARQAVEDRRWQLLQDRHRALHDRLTDRQRTLLGELDPVLNRGPLLDAVQELCAALNVLNVIGPDLQHLQHTLHHAATSELPQQLFPEGDPFKRSGLGHGFNTNSTAYTGPLPEAKPEA